MTYAELIDEVIGRAFPEGYADNLQAIYEKRVLSGLIEAQRWVPWLKQRQYQLYPFNSTLYKQGTTVLCKPAGKVKRVATFSSKTLKDIVYYDPCTREDIDRLTAQRARMSAYPDSVPESFGSFNATASLDKTFRSERGLYCIDERQIILIPHIESTERVMVEWNGSKTDYDDEDTIDYGKYQEQVIVALENWLRWKSLTKDDRSASDYATAKREWDDSIAGLMLDTKDDNEPDLPQEDIGILPRIIMPASPGMVSSLECLYDPTNAFFDLLWMMADNGKYYSLGALLFGDQVVEAVEGSGLTGGKAEVTYETIRCAMVNFKADDDLFYKLAVHIVDGQPVHGFDGDSVDSTTATSCDGVACINLDIKGDDDTYYRINLAIVDGVPVTTISAAPAESESVVPTPTPCGSDNVWMMKDAVTQACVFIRVKNGQLSLSDS